MKTLTLVVAVATVLTIICLQENTTVAEVYEVDVPVMNDNIHDDGDMALESRKIPDNIRKKRSPAGCRFCCGCCPFMRGCGLCCKWNF